MAENFKKVLLALATGVASWFLLSYVFFPIGITAPADVYFAETTVYMLPLKAVITTVFMLFNLFIYEQRQRKKAKENNLDK